eukprot:SAG22_NODE_254_length_13588_cov_10.695678_4_plen_394_part_00
MPQLDGLETIRAYGLGESFAAESAQRSDEANKLQYIQKICDRWLGTRLEMIGNVLCFAAMLLGVLARGEVAGAYIGLSLASSMRLARTVNYCVRNFTQMEAEMTSVERMLHYCSVQTERYLGRGELAAAGAGGWPAGVGGSDSGWPPPLGDSRVEFDRVELRYRPDLPLVLRTVSFTIEAGAKLGVVGRTGSGKSSLVQALFRMVEPCGGRITIGGVDTARLGVAELRSALAICPQDPVIFAGTIAKNLSPFGEHTTSELETALHRVGLQMSPHAAVEESGANLSGGQQQLLCLARTMLRGAQVLVLDEATSSISPEVDASIQRVLREAFGDTTMLVIAHRLQTTLDADAVLILAAGSVRELGSPAELIQRGGQFRAMVDETSGLILPEELQS